MVWNRSTPAVLRSARRRNAFRRQQSRRQPRHHPESSLRAPIRSASTSSDGHVGHFVYPYGVVAFATAWRLRNAKGLRLLLGHCFRCRERFVASRRACHIHSGRPPSDGDDSQRRAQLASTSRIPMRTASPSSTRRATASSKPSAFASQEKALRGGSPEGLALSPDGATLYVANAHSNAVAVVSLSPAAMGAPVRAKNTAHRRERIKDRRAIMTAKPLTAAPCAASFPPANIPPLSPSPTEPSSWATGRELASRIPRSSSTILAAPRMPPTIVSRLVGADTKRAGGEYDVALIAGNYSLIPGTGRPHAPDDTNQVMRNDGLIGSPEVQLFAGKSPIHHVIYIIRENRTYDQVFGDVTRAGNGQPADGDPSLAIFGKRRSRSAAHRPAAKHHAQRARARAAFRLARSLLRQFRS